MTHARIALTAALAVVFSPAFARGQQPVYHSSNDALKNQALSSQPSGFLLIPGAFTDFVRSGGGQFVELPNGTARLTGRVFSQSNLYAALLFDFTLSGRVAPNDPGYPPAGMPNQQLFASAYAPIGPIDVGTFVYYTQVTGTLTGVRNLDGALLTLTASEPVQIGSGANNRNEHFGLHGVFNVVNAPQSQLPLTLTGPATLALDFVAPYGETTTHPQPNSNLTTLTEGRAMVLPGVGDDYLFVPAADFREFPDGHAELLGRLARIAQLDDAWDATLAMTNRVDPGQPGYPPAGSPVLQMLPSAYVQNSGFLDPGHWHYYQNVTGTLVGQGLNEGGEIALTQSVATQVGGGANQTNNYFGCYGAFATNIVTQPIGRTLSITGDAELFALTAVFPVLPFPNLTVPASTPTLPTLTDQGIMLAGDNLAWVELAAVGFDVLAPGDAADWNGGYFRIVDNQHVELHPRPGAVPGQYNVVFYNPAIQTNTVQIDQTAPTAAALYAEPTVGSFGSVHVRIHHGPVTGPALSLVVLSQTLLPSVYPGLASLAIGAGFTDVQLDPVIYSHDAATGIAAADYGPIDPSFLGSYYYFQGLILDIGAGTLPFPPTNYWRVDLL